MNDRLGQHFSLGYAEQIKNSFPGQSPYTIQMRSAIAFTRETDRMILDSIVQKAKENGITDLYVLNEDFILGAIREKMERESKGADAATVTHGKWDRSPSEIGTIDVQSCSVCGCEMTERNQFWNANYCPNCGAKMDK